MITRCAETQAKRILVEVLRPVELPGIETRPEPTVAKAQLETHKSHGKLNIGQLKNSSVMSP